MFKPLFLIMACFICTAAYAQVDTTLVENWKKHPLPSSLEILYAGKPWPIEWAVFFRNDTVHAVNAKDRSIPQLPFTFIPDKKKELFLARPNISFLKVDDGYLVGFDMGEFGGYLYWFTADGKEHYKISYDIIIQFIKKGGKIYAIQGLYHMGISLGSIINIEKENGVWVAKQYVKMPAAPKQIALDKQQNFIVATSKGLVKVDKNLEVKTLVDTAIWNNRAGANSMVIENNDVYIGLFGGVYKYDLNNGKQNWLLNK